MKKNAIMKRRTTIMEKQLPKLKDPPAMRPIVKSELKKKKEPLDIVLKQKQLINLSKSVQAKAVMRTNAFKKTQQAIKDSEPKKRPFLVGL